jgi:hypothetical protein
LRINGVDVIPLVEAEFNRRFPGLAHRRAGNPDDLRAAGAMLEEEWEHLRYAVRDLDAIEAKSAA